MQSSREFSEEKGKSLGDSSQYSPPVGTTNIPILPWGPRSSEWTSCLAGRGRCWDAAAGALSPDGVPLTTAYTAFLEVSAELMRGPSSGSVCVESKDSPDSPGFIP